MKRGPWINSCKFFGVPRVGFALILRRGAGQDLADLGESSSKFGKYLYAASHFYAKYHREAYDIDGISQAPGLLDSQTY